MGSPVDSSHTMSWDSDILVNVDFHAFVEAWWAHTTWYAVEAYTTSVDSQWTTSGAALWDRDGRVAGVGNAVVVPLLSHAVPFQNALT